MVKPVVVLRNVKTSALTHTEHDQNFINLRDSTINFTDGVNTRSMDLNDVTTFEGQHNLAITVDEATQKITVNNTLSDYTLEPMGFENRTDSTISFDFSTRTFSIQPVAVSWRQWHQGEESVKTALETLVIPAVSGLYFIYYSGTSLQYTTGTPSFSTQTPVAYVYYNATAGQAWLADERHGIAMDWATHLYLHRTRGAAFASGFVASNFTTSGNGSSNADAQLDIASGTFFDEDIQIDVVSSNTPTANTFEQDLSGPARIPVVYHSGSTGLWVLDLARDYPVKNGTSLVTYNLNTAGTWTTPDAPNTHYVAYWIVATNYLNHPVMAIMGQRTDNKLEDAEASNTWESLDLTNLPVREMRPLYRLIFRTATAYTNTPKAYLADITDVRQSTQSGGQTASITPNSFGQIAVTGQDTVTAETVNDTLTLVAGTNISLTTDASLDSVTINNTFEVVLDLTPQLGGNLDVNGKKIVSTSNGNIDLEPNGVGDVLLSTDMIKIGDVGGTLVRVEPRSNQRIVLGGDVANPGSPSPYIDLKAYAEVIGLDSADIELVATNYGVVKVRGFYLGIETVDQGIVGGANAALPAPLTHQLVLGTGGIYSSEVKITGSSSANTNYVILNAGNGTSDYVIVGGDPLSSQTGNGKITTNGGDLILNTNLGVNAGTITLFDGSNGNIEIVPNGTGRVKIDANLWPTGDGTVGQYLITNGSGSLSWTSGSNRLNYVLVKTASDLPAAVAGVRQLADNTLYEINGTVVLSDTLNLGTNSMIIGTHLGTDILVYTGVGNFITGTNKTFFMEKIIIVASTGTAVNVTGDLTTEFLWSLVGINSTNTLGTISGFRVPTFLSCNFDTYTNGLTFTGTMNKIYFDGTPFRNGAAGSVGIYFDANFESEIIDIQASYWKTPNATATAIRFDAGAVLTGYGLLRGNSFLGPTTPLVGFGPQTLKWDFKNNTPIRDSRIVGDMYLQGNTTATVLTTNTWTKIAGTTLTLYSERMDMPLNNRLRYIDTRPGVQGLAVVSISVLGTAANQVLEFQIWKNLQPYSSIMRSLITGTVRAESVTLNAIVNFETNDYIEIFMRCTTGNQNATVEHMTVSVTA